MYFSDSDYEVPYYLKHFAQVANAVVETPFTDSTGTLLPRGFLNIKVNRNVADNKPYNARIMEMQMALAYFYTANRPWNPYRGSVPVKDRLEAMLTRWVEMQHPTTGLFTEYSATNWGLAPTAFGAMAAAQSLHMIQTSGLPFDQTVFNNAKAALHKALMAVLTRDDMRAAARGYSNQFSPAYHAAALYLELWPDNPLDTAFVAAVKAASNEDQSKSGYYYEANGPDFGYSNVHERNLRIALPLLRGRTNTNNIMPVINTDEARWSAWLGANLVLQPNISTPTFMVNAGINTRTSTASQTPESRPLSEFTPLSRAFSYTGAEFTNTVRAKTDALAATPTYGTLATNSAYSYQPSFVYEALQRTETWHPTDGERAAAINTLPYLASTRFNRILHDSRRPLSVAAVRRPAYYGLFNYGNVTVANQVKLGLGLLWNPSFGTFLQAVSGNTNSAATTWGTVRSAVTNAYEQRATNSNIGATVRVNGNAVTPAAGTNNLADGLLTATYNLADVGTTFGSKVVTFDEDRVKVDVSHTNTTNRIFTERIPLIAPSSATRTTTATQLTLAHTNGSRLIMRLLSGGSFTVATASADNLPSALRRHAVTVTATNALSYELLVTSDAFVAGALGAPVSESYSPANAGADAGETVIYNLPLLNQLGGTTSTNFNATLQASGGVVPVTTNRVYGAVAPGATATQPFSFTVDGNFGAPLTITLALRDGTNNYGLVSYQTMIGGVSTATTTTTWQNFDGVTAPALPSGWVASVPSGTAGGWTTSTNTPNAAPNAVTAAPTAVVSEQRLDSPSFTVPPAVVDPEIRFQHRWNTEPGFDGGVVEISVDGGAYTDVLDAGCSFLSGAYTGTLGTGYQNPLSGRQAWHGSNDASYTQTRLAVPSSMLGKSVRLRFRLGCDSSVNPAGAVWRIDTLQFVYKALNYIQPAQITSAAPPSTVQVGSPYTHAFAATGHPAPGFAVTSGTLPSGLTLSPSGVLSGTAASSFSTRTITVSATNGVTPVSTNATQTFTLQSFVSLSVSTASLGGGTVGTAYAATLAATGGTAPYGWSLASGALPAGLSLSSSGVISGTPLAAGTSNFTVAVTDGNGASATKALSIISSNPASLSVVTPSLPAGQVAAAYSQALSAVSGTAPYTWSLASGSLPAGLSLSAGGVIAGTPVVSGTSGFTVRVTDAATATATRAFTLSVSGSIDITTAALPDVRTGTAYSATLGVSGGVAPFTWSIRDGALPPGLVLSEDGTISGTASALGAFIFTVRVTDANNSVAEREYTLQAVNTLTWDAQPDTSGIQTGNGSWTTATNTTNWSLDGTNVAWVDGSDAVIGGGTLTTATPLTVGNITFNTNIVVNGPGPITLKDGAIITANGGESTLAAPLAGTSFTKNGASRLILSSAGYAGEVNIATGELRLNEPAGERTWHGTISGGGNFVKSGAGTLTLAASNSLTGFFTVTEGGALRVTHPRALGTTNNNTTIQGGTNFASVIIDGDGMVLAEAFQLVMHNQSNAPHFQLRNAGGTNTVTGNLLLNSGGARWDIGSESGRIRFDGAVSNIANVATADTWRTLYLTGPGGGEFNGIMQDTTNGLSKLNVTVVSGDWTLGGSNKIYTGNTIVNNGSLRVATGLNSEVRLLGGSFSGSGHTTANMVVASQATILRSLTDWASPGAGFGAARLIGTNNPAWTVRIDAAGLTNFSEISLSLPIVTVSDGVTGLSPASVSVEIANFPGQGTWSAQTNSTGLSVVYAPVPLTIGSEALPEAMVGELYLESLPASGGVSPRQWTLVAGHLPPGLNLSPDGVLSGTPPSLGISTFTVRVTDAAGVAVEQEYVLPVVSPLVVFTGALSGAITGAYYAEYLQAYGGLPGYTWSLIGGQLPQGLSLKPDGELVGLPGSMGQFVFTVAVTDAAQATASRELTMQVAPAPGSYDEWATQERWRWPDAAASDPGADPDADGLSNLMECAFDLDPLVAGESPYRVESVAVGGQPYLVLTFRRSSSSNLFVYTVMANSNLRDPNAWSPVAVGRRGEALEPLGADVEVSEEELPDGAFQVTVTEPISPGAPARFLRVEVQESAP